MTVGSFQLQFVAVAAGSDIGEVIMGKSVKALLVASVASVALVAPAHAQKAATNEIVVTATKREEAVQDVPIAISVLSAQDLEAAGATDVQSAISQLAGVEFRNAQAGTGAISIRGIAELNTDNIFGSTGTAVGLYIDEAPFSVGGFFPQAVLFDAARIEVLRGPQGTIFGEGSLAGTVRIVTNRPDAGKVEGNVEGRVGFVEDGGTNGLVNGMINLPIISDVMALRVVGFWQQDGGWIDRTDATVTAEFLAQPNPVLGPSAPDVRSVFTLSDTQSDANDAETWGGRAQLGVELGSDVTATASVILSRADRGYRNRGATDGTGFFSTDLEGMQDDFELYGLVLEWRFAGGSLLSSTNYFDRRIDQTLDQFGIIPLANQIGVPLTGGQFVFQGSRVDQELDVSEFNQELRFVSDFEGPFQLIAGAFYRERDTRFVLQGPQEPLTPAAVAEVLCGGLCGFTEPGSGDLDTTTDATSEQIAVFAEATYDFSDQWQLLLGGRWFNDKRTSRTLATSLFSGIPFETQFSSRGEDDVFNPRATLRFTPSDAVTVYASYSRGFRSGGQNDLFVLVPGATPEDQTFGSERMTAYEIGLKSSFADGRGLLNAAVFYNDWDNLQLVTAEGVGGVGEIIGNAGSARSYGIDLESRFELGGGFDITANATLLDTRVRDVIASGTFIAEARIPGTADFTAAGALNWRGALSGTVEGFARASVRHAGNTLSNVLRLGTPAEINPSFTTVDLRAGAEFSSIRIEVFAENLFDEFVPLDTFYAPNASNPNGGDPITGRLLFLQGPPRVIGARIGMRF
jgi:outer membrane receptor protein involved in Fe transport